MLTESVDVDELDMLSVVFAMSRDVRRGEVRVETGFGMRVRIFEEEDDIRPLRDESKGKQSNKNKSNERRFTQR